MNVIYSTPYGDFEWDSQKNAINLKKHGLSFELACEVFADAYAVQREDRLHSGEEQRWQIIGQTIGGEVLLVVIYTERTRIRIISARQAEKKEKNTYVDRS